jgi:branched-chain amino acid transport system substrate-binding protein
MQVRRAALLTPLLALGLAACAGGSDEPSAGSSEGGGGGGASSDCGGSIGLMAPITGGAASIGGEQLNFATLALDTFNEQEGTSYELVEGDTQLDPGQASTVAQQFTADEDVLAVVGPAGSQEVEAVGPAFATAELAFISPSATRTSLTEGEFPTFFRVIPTDAVQGPTDAEFIVGELDAQKVVIVEERTSYGQGLADAVSASLSEQGVEAVRIPVNQDQPDYSAVVSRVAADTDVVFVTFQIAANTKVLANQLQSQGKSAVVFASDGSFSADFDVPGSYVSSFAPDIRGVEQAADVVEAYTAEYDDEFGTFGPPVYVATQAALQAALRACEAADGGSADRAAVLEEVRSTEITDSVLGDTVTFTESGDVEGAQFYIFQLGEDGTPELVQ